MRLTKKHLILLSGAVWLAAGISLLRQGIVLLMHSLHSESGLLLSLLSTTTRRNGVIGLICTALVIGYLKGRFVLRKSALRTCFRIDQLEPPIGLRQLYTPGMLFLVATMMALGMLLKASGIADDIRGFVDVAIGAALTQGAITYWRYDPVATVPVHGNE